MDKRVEIYVGFKCNNNCLFCVEKRNRDNYKSNIYYKDKNEIKEKIADLYNKGYNHINFLGGEPFIEKNFLSFLQFAKQYNFSTAVTTNASMLANESVAQSHLPLINDLILSIHGHNKELVNKQSQNEKLYDNLILAFPNIKNFFSGRLLKVNCVINKLNYEHLLDILEFIEQQGIKEISFTNMAIKDFNNDMIVRLNKLSQQIKKTANYAQKNNITLRFSDIPFCILGEKYALANELYCDERQKFNIKNEKESFMRPKIKTGKCKKCKLNYLCPGIDLFYYEIFGDIELIPQL